MANYALVVKHTARQKSIGLRVKPGVVELSCPRWTTQELIDRVLRDRADWIARQLGECARLPQVQKPVPEEGATWMFRGDPHALTIVPGNKQVHAVNGVLRVSVPTTNPPPGLVSALLDHFFKAEALSHFRSRTQYFAEQIGVLPTEVRIRRYRARWGSCSAQGVVTYHWPIIQAPDWVSDYLIVHELAHLVHFDHSPAFWAVVESVMPQWRDARRWLKERGAVLLLP